MINKIFLFDKKFNLVKEFPSKREAMEFLGIGLTRLNTAIRQYDTLCRGFYIKKSRIFYDYDREQLLKKDTEKMNYFKEEQLEKKKVMNYKDYLAHGVKTKQFDKIDAKESYIKARKAYRIQPLATL
jgi:hypothetical protein